MPDCILRYALHGISLHTAHSAFNTSFTGLHRPLTCQNAPCNVTLPSDSPLKQQLQPGRDHQCARSLKAPPPVQTTGKRMGQIVRFEMDEPETAGVQTQVPVPVDSPINLTDEEEKMSRDANAEIRHKAHQALESLMDGNARFRKVI